MDLTDDPLAGVDASELEADIDKAIDELFVKKGDAQKPAVTDEVTPEETPEKPAAKSAEEPTVTLTAEDPLAHLKENLLTLDWEITSASIQALEKELQTVSGKLSEDRHSMAVIKMALGVLQYLRAAKSSAAPISVQFLHGAIRGLDIFVRQPAPSDSERGEVMDKLLGQFRRVKAEIQKVKPLAAAAQPAEDFAAAEPEQPVEQEPDEEADLEEITGEEPVLEEVSTKAEDMLEEVALEEVLLEDVPTPEPGPETPAEEADAAEEFTFEDVPTPEPGPETPAELGDAAEEFIFEDVPTPEPGPETPAELGDAAEEFIGEEPMWEDFSEEESTLAADLEAEPLSAEFHEEESTLDVSTAEELIAEDLFEEGPALEETAEEEVTHTPVVEEELAAEEVSVEDLDLEGVSQEEPALEQPGESEVTAPISEVGAAETSPLKQLIREAHDNSGQLSGTLAALNQESSGFFGRILSAMAGKPSLERLEKYFGSAHKTIETKLSEAEELSRSLGVTLTKLEENLEQQETTGLAPQAKADIGSQVSIIQNAVRSINEATSKLQQNLAGAAVDQRYDKEKIAFSDAQLDTEEFALESDEIMESLDSEPVLDLLDEIPSEASGRSPGTLTSIYLADVANNTLGIPTEDVVNVFKVSKRRAKGFRKKGFVKLGDFKGAFTSIKRGITGPLAHSKPKELKKIQFPIINLSPEILGSDDTEAVAPVRGIVLLSTGERHGALLTDEVMQRTPYEVKGYRKAGLPGEVSGTATIEGDFEINVLDPDYVLS